MDVWSRRIVGSAVWEQETATLAATLIQQICEQSNVDPKGLILHSDNGGPMRGATMIATLQWLGIVPSFSRPHVSDDNPYSEALFRTLKYSPAYPNRPFANVEQARNWVDQFVSWYNSEHRHSGIRYVTPDQRHFGQEPSLLRARQNVYERARHKHPERWSGAIRDWTPIGIVVLNPEPNCSAA
jgi:transposase InsO family protein